MKIIFISNEFKTFKIYYVISNVPIVLVSCILSYFVFVVIRETVK